MSCPDRVSFVVVDFLMRVAVSMTNNDILRRVRFIFDFSDSQMMALFASGGFNVAGVGERLVKG